MGTAGQDTPRKRMAAHVLVRDEDGRVLLVEPTYEDSWLLPGGAVEADESPRAACAREAAEELGLDLPIGRLLCLEWHGPQAGLTEALMFVYDGGTIPATTPLRLAARELASSRWVEPAGVGELVADRLARRVHAALRAVELGRLVEMEDGAVIR